MDTEFNFFSTQSFHVFMLVLLSTVILLQWRVLGVEYAVCVHRTGRGKQQCVVSSDMQKP